MECLSHNVELAEPINLFIMVQGFQLHVMLVTALADVTDPGSK
jgi:hypothetical protein